MTENNHLFVQFENGYGASVIQEHIGKDMMLYELAVLCENPDEESIGICYETPLADDVQRVLRAEQVLSMMLAIQALPPVDHNHSEEE